MNKIPCTSSQVEQTYNMLVGAQEAALEKMIAGNELKDVHAAVSGYVRSKNEALLPHLPKTLGFAIGLEFRDSTLLLNASNANKFETGMILNVSIGFHKIPLGESDRSGASEAVKKLNEFSLLLADTVIISKEGPPEILTKAPKDFASVSYNLGDTADGENGVEEVSERRTGSGPQLRDRGDKAQAEQLAVQRQIRQQELMAQRIEEARRRLQEKGEGIEETNGSKAEELRAYRSPDDYPREVTSYQLKVDGYISRIFCFSISINFRFLLLCVTQVDIEREVVFCPIGGKAVPFHVSTIKSISKPDPDKATYLRINFYTPGAAMPKEAPKNMTQLVLKHGEKVPFIKDLTFRSMDPRNIEQVYRIYQEMRKRIRQREQKAEQEKDLVVQAKLQKIKDQRAPQLQDLTMRPQLTGRKCVGGLAAHQNGLRFVSSKGEVLDILYDNIKHAIFQPCENSVMVLIHFHLKDFIMIGKKKHKDVQFYYDVVESSLNLDASHRSSYDPDELDEEQRERETRRRLNNTFKDFCKKVSNI